MSFKACPFYLLLFFVASDLLLVICNLAHVTSNLYFVICYIIVFKYGLNCPYNRIIMWSQRIIRLTKYTLD